MLFWRSTCVAHLSHSPSQPSTQSLLPPCLINAYGKCFPNPLWPLRSPFPRLKRVNRPGLWGSCQEDNLPDQFPQLLPFLAFTHRSLVFSMLWLMINFANLYEKSLLAPADPLALEDNEGPCSL